MSRYFVLLNGPPRSGKDMLTAHLAPYIKFRHMKFAAPIKRAVAGLLDIGVSEIEGIKDKETAMLRYADSMRDGTVRQLLILMSETLLKPYYGDDFFGRVFWQQAKNGADDLVIASDCGFEPEVRRLTNNAGQPNCLLLRIHREGTTFTGDSRSYLPDGLCETIDIHNNDSMHMLTMMVLRTITKKFNVPLLKEPEWVK